MTDTPEKSHESCSVEIKLDQARESDQSEDIDSLNIPQKNLQAMKASSPFQGIENGFERISKIANYSVEKSDRLGCSKEKVEKKNVTKNGHNLGPVRIEYGTQDRKKSNRYDKFRSHYSTDKNYGDVYMNSQTFKQ